MHKYIIYTHNIRMQHRCKKDRSMQIILNYESGHAGNWGQRGQISKQKQHITDQALVSFLKIHTEIRRQNRNLCKFKDPAHTEALYARMPGKIR